MAFKLTKDPIQVKIPMKPYVVKFLKKNYGSNHKISRRSWLGKSLLHLLTFKFAKPPKMNPMSSFTFIIPMRMCLEYGYFVDHSKYKDIADVCEDVFKKNMFSHIHINAVNGSHGEVMNSLRNYFDFYDITEDDFKLESAYRAWLRYIKDKSNTTQKKRCQKKAS